LETGADDLIDKPFDIDALLKILEKHNIDVGELAFKFTKHKISVISLILYLIINVN